ncbi:MAG: hypothetical protein LQ342_006318 [Letrouitia transgressa]|nr:MAG: hypothetical protein LQ342_006318 [Letrouitia transgressa]
MPFIRDNSSRSSSSSDGQRRSLAGSNQIVDDDEYPAVSFPGYAEKPLSEQLEPIAVVGMGCRLPGDVDSPEGFWDLMMNRRSGMTPKVPKSRFNIDAHFHANNDRPGSFNVMGGYFLHSDLQEFDPALFGISPVEAMWMDPQQRKLLEVVYEAFESGGATLQSVAGSNTACFAGSFTADFQQMSFKEPDFRHSYAATGVDPGIISNRVNHVFNLKGPSITVNTACSSSVYAIHNACNALRNDECTAAVVAGTNLILTVDQHMNTAKLGVLSPDSTCHTFQETANGYGRAEGVGAVYLKRLSDAVRDGDPIRAVVRSSAVNSNGKAPAVGITHPNKQGQVDVIRHAYHRGGDLDPRLTGYFECHGTGTAIGDPLEVHAVAKAMNGPRKAGEEPLWIGAVKTNIGHSEAASGLSAIIKACLTVEKGIIPPTRIVDKLSNKIEWDNWKVRVVQEPQPFPAHLPVRRVSVNSFGYGGTNAHIIIENVESFVPGYQHAQRKSKSRRAHDQNRPYLLPFSAHDKPTLKHNIEAYGKVAGNYNLLDLSYTLATRRSNLQSKGFVVATDATLKNAFANNGESFAFAEKKKKPTIGFAFTGQGAQWARMGSHLMEYYPSFLRSIRKLDQALEDLPDAPEWTLEDTLLESAEKSRVNEAEFSQPLCTAIQVALVELLSTWGVQPIVTVGHSSGEIAASFAAGFISATEAIIVAYYRGKVVRDVNTNGAMMAVGLGAEAVEPYLADVDGKVVIACHNSPMSVTLSGDADALETVKAKLDAQKVFARPVKTGGKAYHSSHMQAVADQYKTHIRNAKKNSPFDPPTPTKAVMVSSVTDGALDRSHKVDENYWCQNLTSPVLFNQAIQRIATDDRFSKVDLLIEIGPHSALSGPIRQICVEHGFEKLGYIPSLVRNADSAQQLLKVAGELFLRNYPLDMERVTVTEEALPSGKINLANGKMLVDLPCYQWNYAKNLWAEPRGSAEHRTPRRGRHDILGSRMPGGSKVEPIWRNALRIRDIPWLNSHSLGGEAVFPAAGYFSMAMEAITQINEDSAHPEEIRGYVLRDVSIKAALVTPDTDDGIEVLFSMRPSVFSEIEAQVTWWDFNVSSITEDGLVKDHMTGTISINTRPRGEKPKKIPNLPQRASGKSWNQGLRDVGFDYGPGFQDMTDIHSDGKNFMAASDTVVKQACGDMIGESRHVLHPGTVDSCLQLIIVSIYAGRLNDMACGAVPIQVDEVAIWPPTPEQLKNPAAKAFSWTDHRGIRSFQSGSQLTAFDGEVLMDITDMRTTAYEAALPPKADDAAETQPFMEMVWKCDIDSLASTSQLQQVDVNRIVELAAHKNPSIRVLEIGSNNAAAILSKSSILRYTATEVSEEGVNAAKEVIKDYKNAKAQPFDLSQDIEEQGLSQGTYDLVIATNAIWDSLSLGKIRSLLTIGGRAIFKIDGDVSTASLHKTGFSGIDLAVPTKGPLSLVLSTATDTQQNGYVNGVSNNVTLLHRNKPTPFNEKVEKAAIDMGWSVQSKSLKDCVGASGEHVILLADLEGPLLPTLQESELAGLRDLTTSASSILWVTPGGLLHGKSPEYGMTAGLARSVTSENASLDLTTLDFDLSTTATADVVSIIIRSVDRQIRKEETRETEYCVENGLTYISRLLPNDRLNASYTVNENDAEVAPFSPEKRVVGKVQSGKVVFETDQRTEEPVPPNHVEVKVSLAGLSKEDTLVINGTDYPTDFSHEVFGVISKIGPDVHNLKVGDRVVGFSFDKFASYQRTPADLVHKVEKNDSPEELAALPMSYAAAIYGLMNLAKVEANENVLIMNGTGGPGFAAIKIAQVLKAKTFVAVESDAEAERLVAEFHLPREEIIKPSRESINSQLSALTGGHGVDVVFSCAFSSATVARECWRHLAPFGRFVDFGRKNVLKRSVLDTLPLHQGANYLSFDLLDLYTWKPETLASLLRLTVQFYRLFKKQSISPIGRIGVKNITELNKAVSSYSDNFLSAKTLISYTQSETPLKVLPKRPTLKFRPDATYLLVGCLGGLGRSLTSWMMQRGARRFAFLSRSGTDSEQAAILVRDIEAAGVSVQVIRGDATSKDDVERALKGIPAEYPVRGVVQAAMVLRDGMFHSMSYNNWITATKPKVEGTMNLHNALGDTPLDFFVMTSSVSGTLGTPGQANYSAANSFLDALARHRVAKGRPAASLVLPMVLGVGVVAENQEIEEALKRKGMYGIDEEHLLESFEAAMVTQTSDSPADHVISGLDPAKLQKSISGSETTDAFWIEDLRFKNLVHSISSGDSAAGGGQSALSTIKASKSPAEAVQFVTDYFIEKLARLLLVDLDEFEPDVKPVAEYGLDSMIGAELRNWIFKELALDIPFQQLLGPGLTITKFATQVCANQVSDQNLK